MSDLATSRIPRETLSGLLADTSDERDRITAQMPAARLDQLLDHDEHRVDPAELVVRFHSNQASTAAHAIIWSCLLTLLVGALVVSLV